MKKQISKDTLENCLCAVETALKDSFPVNSSVVSNFGEIMRLALKGYELEFTDNGKDESQISIDRSSVPQLGIR